MASENEMLADIVAQMRDPEGMGYTVGNTANGADISEDTAECMATFADRIEAAWKRERESLSTKQGENVNSGSAVYTGENKGGNAAAMREALTELVEYALLAMNMSMFNRERLSEIVHKAKAALSASPRNCDVGTAEEQDNRMDVYCQNRKCESCPLWDNANNGVRCEFTWAQTLYAKEGGAQ